MKTWNILNLIEPKKLKSNTITIYDGLENNLRVSSSINCDSDSANNEISRIRSGILSVLFNAGADPLCPDSNRKRIYKYWNLNRGSDDELKEV